VPIAIFAVVALGAFILGVIIGALKAAGSVTCDRYHIEDAEQAFDVLLNVEGDQLSGCNAV